MTTLDARYGGTIVYTARRDTGGMFDARVGVERLPFVTKSGNEYRTYAADWHGGVQCFRPTLEEAMSEIDRLLRKLHG